MPRARYRVGLTLAALAAAGLVAAPPCAAAGGGPQAPRQPLPGSGNVVVEQVENGPLFGAEFKFTTINGDDAYLLGGYGGYIFDDTFFIGGAGYFQVDSWYQDYDYCDGGHDYYDDYCDYDVYRSANAYGGFLAEWYALRSSAVSLSVRGLVGGGISRIDWDDYPYSAAARSPRHGPAYPPPGGYYVYDQTYFVFEPQVNVSVRVARHVAIVGGAGYRVIGWANGLEDQIGGFTATAAVRIGGK